MANSSVTFSFINGLWIARDDGRGLWASGETFGAALAAFEQVAADYHATFEAEADHG